MGTKNNLTSETEKAPVFFKLKGGYYKLTEILSVQKTKKKDGENEFWKVNLTSDAAGTSLEKYKSLWVTGKEIASLVAYLERYSL